MRSEKGAGLEINLWAERWKAESRLSFLRGEGGFIL